MKQPNGGDGNYTIHLEGCHGINTSDFEQRFQEAFPEFKIQVVAEGSEKTFLDVRLEPAEEQKQLMHLYNGVEKQVLDLQKSTDAFGVNQKIQKPIAIYIEGCIGVGKSEFIRRLQASIPELKKRISAILGKEDPIIDIQLEPVKDWEDIGLLEAFYQDPKKYAYPFQSYAFLTRFIRCLQNEHADVVFFERSIWADRYAFAKINYEEGNLSEMEWKIYCKWFDQMISKFTSQTKSDLNIYLQGSLETCQKRIKKRSRNGEEGIPSDYLEKLITTHEEWLLKSDNVEILDMNKDWLGSSEEEYTDTVVDIAENAVLKAWRYKQGRSQSDRDMLRSSISMSRDDVE